MFTSKYIKKVLGKQCVVALLLLAFVCAPINLSLQPQRAEAIPVYDAANWIINGITAAATTAAAASQSFLALKEGWLDGIAFMMLNLVLHEMSQQIVSWINSGFQGSPAFVQDFGGFLTGVADKVAGNYIWGSKLNFLCSPFKLDIRIALDIQYKKSRDYKIMCTLSGVSNNILNAANSFNPTTNWDQWFQVSTRAENNVYGSLLLAQEELNFQIADVKYKKTIPLNFGNGFFPKEKCETVEDESGGHQECKTVTPGTAIQAQLNNTLDSGRQRIQVADEINEIIAALFSQLAKQAFAGAAGLLGLTQDNGGGTYYDQLAQSTDYDGLTYDSSDPIEKAIGTETKWRDLHIEQAALVQGAKTYLAASCMASFEFPNDLQLVLTSALAEAANANVTIETLDDMQAEIAADAGTPNAAATKARVMQEYMEMQTSGELHTEMDIVSFKMIDLKDTEDDVAAYKATIDRTCNQPEQT